MVRSLTARLTRSALLVAGLAAATLAPPSHAAGGSKPVDISAALNTQCQITGNVPTLGRCGIDDAYASYIAESMPAKGTITAFGTQFTWLGNGATAKDGVMASGQTIAIPGADKGFKSLALLAAASDSDPKIKGPYAFTITYTDGSKVTQKVAVLGWRGNEGKCALPGVKTQYIAAATSSGPGCVDFVPLLLNPRKAVKSLTLPPGRVLVDAISFSQTTTKPKVGPVFH